MWFGCTGWFFAVLFLILLVHEKEEKWKVQRLKIKELLEAL